MNRPILVCTLFVAATAALGAQQASQTSPYQGTSNPPSDDTITTSSSRRPSPRRANLPMRRRPPRGAAGYGATAAICAARAGVRCGGYPANPPAKRRTG